jgi:hypothetical protein
MSNERADRGWSIEKNSEGSKEEVIEIGRSSKIERTRCLQKSLEGGEGRGWVQVNTLE